MTLYFGSKKIADTGKKGVYFGSKPIKAIYKGSQLIYQYNSLVPATIIYNTVGEVTYTTDLDVGVYEVEIVGGGGGCSYGWYYACFQNSGGSGASVRGQFYNPKKQSFTFYAPKTNGANKGLAAYMNVGSTRVLTAGGGGYCHANGSCSGNTGGTGTIAISGIENISIQAFNGNKGNYAANSAPALAGSVALHGDWGNGSTCNCGSSGGQPGAVYLQYIRYSK